MYDAKISIFCSVCSRDQNISGDKNVIGDNIIRHGHWAILTYPVHFRNLEDRGSVNYLLSSEVVVGKVLVECSYVSLSDNVPEFIIEFSQV